MVKREKLSSFYFSAFQATRANVFGGNRAVFMLYLNFLQIGVVAAGGLAVGVADQIPRKFSFIANAAYS